MKIAIISCYNEGEANSEYTKALENEMIALGHNVEILRLPFSIFGNSSSSGRKQANVLINQYARRLPEFDYVNIHYEFALFGRKEKDVLAHVLTLIKACKEKAFSIVFHNFPEDKIIKPFKLKIMKFRRKLSPSSIAQIIFREVEKKKGTAIVHVFRHQRFINVCCPELKTIVMPLRFNRNENLRVLQNNFSKEAFMCENGISLPDDAKIISIIGTLQSFKDNISVIKTLTILPENYHLFIFGGMHKHLFKYASQGLPHILKAQQVVTDLKLINRVHFMGYQETTQDIQNANLFSDYIVMPYMEVGESASAAAYTALELCKYVFCTRNNCFEELNAFCSEIGGSPVFQYDMGHYMELAEKIKTLPHKDRILKNRINFLEKYSITENAKRCIGL